MKHNHILAIALTLVSSLAVSADLRAESLDNVAIKILSESPAVKSIISAKDSEILSYLPEGNLPDPEVEGEYMVSSSDSPNRWGASIGWNLEWPGVYGARKDAAVAKSELSTVESTASLIQKMTETKSFLADYILYQKNIATLLSISETTDSLIKVAEKAREYREMSVIDLNKLRLERASLSARIAEIKNQCAEVETSLSVIYGSDCSAVLTTLDLDLPSALSEKASASLTNPSSPQLAAALATLNVREHELKATRRESLPGISIAYNHAFEDANHFNGASVGVSIPVFSSRNKRKAAEAAVNSAQTDVESVMAENKAWIESSMKRITLLNEELAATSPLIENTDNQEILLKAYRNGVINLITYLNERNYFLEAEISLNTLRHTRALAIIALESLVSPI